MSYTANKKCLCCDSTNLQPYLDLGDQPLANSYHKGVMLEKYPLVVQVCKDCWHNQLTMSVNPSQMFEHYVYISDTSKTLTDYFTWLCDWITGRNGKAKNILEIASNSGLFLEMFKNKGLSCVGVDPAANLKHLADARGLETINDYWPTKKLEGAKFDIIAAIHVLPHVPNPLEFLIACRKSLADGGRVYIQTSQCNMFENNEFDAIYHEHTSYFTAHSFAKLARRAGFYISDVKKVPIHSMSFLFELQAGDAPHHKDVEAIQFLENRFKLTSMEGYTAFARKAEGIAQELEDEIHKLRDMDVKVVGYGASAKCSTVFNYIGTSLDYIVDDNALKFGFLTPGRDMPIVSIEKLKEETNPVVIVLTAWNFAHEIIERVKKECKVQHRFLKYFPEVAYVND